MDKQREEQRKPVYFQIYILLALNILKMQNQVLKPKIPQQMVLKNYLVLSPTRG